MLEIVVSSRYTFIVNIESAMFTTISHFENVYAMSQCLEEYGTECGRNSKRKCVEPCVFLYYLVLLLALQRLFFFDKIH